MRPATSARVDCSTQLSLRELAISTAALAGFLWGLGRLLVAVLGAPPIEPPPIPLRLPSAVEIDQLLRSPNGAQLAAVGWLLAWAAWLAWAWLVASIALRALLVGGERVAAGARWVRSVATLSNLLTFPAVQHAIDRSLAGLLLARVAWGVMPVTEVRPPTPTWAQIAAPTRAPSLLEAPTPPEVDSVKAEPAEPSDAETEPIPQP